MDVDVFSDVICPWCFVGKRRLERTLKMRPDLKAHIRWRAFQLNPDMPAEGIDRDAYLKAKFGGAAEARPVYEAVAKAGEAEGIRFAFDRIKRTPNTLDAHRLIRFAAEAGSQERVVELLFQRYFEEGCDMGDAEVLAEAGAEAGLDAGTVRAHLASADGIEAVKGEDALARRMGITGVPCFIVAGRYAMAGAHAPEALLRLFELGKRPLEAG